MKRTIGVFLGDATRRLGTLRFDSQGARQSESFEYDREWLAALDRFALEPESASGDGRAVSQAAGPRCIHPSSSA
jgi:hypothetical protein